MNQDLIKGKWTKVRGTIQNHWSLLTDDDIKRISGKYESLVGKLQERYGYTEREAKQKIRNFSAKAKKNAVNLKQIGNSINKQAKQSPWTLAGITTVGGLVAGMLIRNTLFKNNKLRLKFFR